MSGGAGEASGRHSYGVGVTGSREGSMRIVVALLLLLLGFSTEGHAQALKAGDTISISVFQDSKLDRQTLIGPTGMISFPLAGQIKAAGLTPPELENLLKSKLRDKYTSDLDITVSLISQAETPEASKDEEKPRFFITGEVKTPGSFLLTKKKMTVVQGIALAGGLGPFAARQRIQVRRKINGAESLFVFDYSAFEAGTNLKENVELREGDVIIVPERGLFD
jgi:polysaccharide export outer membrane protein